MRSIFFLMFSLTGVAAYAQPTGSLVTIGRADNLYSHTLQENRTLWITTPHNMDTANRYPVLYVLDAEEYFYSTVAMVQQFSGVIPEMIVVGIINTNRDRDFTPNHIEANRLANNAAVSGGAENFMRFIEKELMPHIDSLYPTAPYRVFSGHSLGGLSVIHALTYHPRLFNAYIALEPSLWWDNGSALQHAEQALHTPQFDKRSLFVGIANNMPPGMDTLTALKDTTDFTILFRSVKHLVGTLGSVNSNGLRWSYKFYPNERHGTIQLNGQYDALRYLFDFYQFRVSAFRFDPKMNIDSAITVHYKNVSAMMGYRVFAPESMINDLGYTCMSLQKYDKAYAFFKMNIDNYPGSANVYDSMGDYYSSRKEWKQAADSYAHALRIQESADTRRKLEDVKGKQ